MNTLLSDLKNAVETMSKFAFDDFLIEMIKNLEIELLNSSIYQDVEKKIFFDKLYLFSLQAKKLELSFYECRQKQIEIKSEIKKMITKSKFNLTTEKNDLYNHINEIKKTLTDGSPLPYLASEEISKILEKIKNDDIDIFYIKHIENVILNLKYKVTSNLDRFSIDRSVRIDAGQVKKYKESKEKTILYINENLTPLLSNHKNTEKEIEEKRIKNDTCIELEDIWKEHLNHFFDLGYTLDTTLRNVLSNRYKGPRKPLVYDSEI
ncbi:hypothetical protein ACV8MQ_08360 [Klebsiella pneumoniae]|uniref:hypothetical protein n=1 Tax=Klebsiella TaxID=570 RepID=UPI0012B79196|nr:MULTISPECIES: hypothetical protein [Klebsiella]HCT9584734.1 hypothetical protein [Raoultella ornithinolytica]EKV6345337.1 hypothetical protein [Klebsiella pneumoniae]ELB4055079.1 hypothetical protein [Klebsiella pneumoniae]MBE0111900.1 hypothetical protein [Klebsiella michiganensis]MCW1426078.1 hypothetical protein [Klebsiella pneumoniae]